MLNEIVIDGTLRKITYHAICAKLQVRDSPHVLCSFWVVNAPFLTSYNKEEYVAFVDQIVHTFLPDRKENPELHALVKLHQLHRYMRTCIKYKYKACRFKFGKFSTKGTVIAESLRENMPEEIKL